MEIDFVDGTGVTGQFVQNAPRRRVPNVNESDGGKLKQRLTLGLKDSSVRVRFPLLTSPLSSKYFTHMHGRIC